MGDSFVLAAGAMVTGLIEKAISRLEEALNPDYWINGFILDEKEGKHAFDRLRQAVLELSKVVDSGAPEAGAAQAAIDEIVSVAALLAENALEIAESSGGDPFRIDQALTEIALAEDAWAMGDAAKALEHYRKAWEETIKATRTLDAEDFAPLAEFGRDFAIGQDWTGTDTIDFWFKGTGSGEPITILLKDNRAPDPGPSGWSLVWSDEFDDPAGTPPNPANWTYEIGDVLPDGNVGWGNSELQYYSDDLANVATDGLGNLVITIDEADPALECYYGPCEYESARLISQHKAEFAYGRIEARLLVPDGGDGLWPAFWSLGTDILFNPWPAAGEIDFMEYVSRIPNEIFGTIHGPGYNGGGSFGNVYDFGEPVSNNYHTFTVEWEPNLITWYVDGIQYASRDSWFSTGGPFPARFDVDFHLLLNLAVGGNYTAILTESGITATLPAEIHIDYIRVYDNGFTEVTGPGASPAPIGPAHSGSWNNEDQRGHGFSMEFGNNFEGNPYAVIYWYIYDDTGQPIFMVGQGTPEGNRVEVTFYSPVGMIYGEFDPGAVPDPLDVGGTGVFEFADSDNATFSYAPSEFSETVWGHSTPVENLALKKFFGIPAEPVFPTAR